MSKYVEGYIDASTIVVKSLERTEKAGMSNDKRIIELLADLRTGLHNIK